MRRLLGVFLLGVLALPGRAADEGPTKFVPLFNGKDLEGWEVYPSGTGEWKVEGGALVGSGRASHLFTKRDDFTDFHLRAEVMINDGGNSGMYFRTRFGPGFPRGYEAQVNSTHRDPVKTGSLYGFPGATVKDVLVKPDTWFTYEVIARGNHITIKVNGKPTVNDFVDAKNTFTRGRFAFQQHHVGSVVKVRKVEVKELKPEK